MKMQFLLHVDIDDPSIGQEDIVHLWLRRYLEMSLLELSADYPIASVPPLRFTLLSVSTSPSENMKNSFPFNPTRIRAA